METSSVLLPFYAGNSPHKGQWHGALVFSLNCAWISGSVNNREAGDLNRHRAHYDVISMDTQTIHAIAYPHECDMICPFSDQSVAFSEWDQPFVQGNMWECIVNLINVTCYFFRRGVRTNPTTTWAMRRLYFDVQSILESNVCINRCISNLIIGYNWRLVKKIHICTSFETKMKTGCFIYSHWSAAFQNTVPTVAAFVGTLQRLSPMWAIR